MAEARDPQEQELLKRANEESRARLRDVGVQLTGRETSDELANLVEAVERFETVVESHGGDLMVDEGPGGTTREPDDVHFVLPKRTSNDTVADFLGRLAEATDQVRHHQRHKE